MLYKGCQNAYIGLIHHGIRERQPTGKFQGVPLKPMERSGRAGASLKQKVSEKVIEEQQGLNNILYLSKCGFASPVVPWYSKMSS